MTAGRRSRTKKVLLWDGLAIVLGIAGLLVFINASRVIGVVLILAGAACLAAADESWRWPALKVSDYRHPGLSIIS